MSRLQPRAGTALMPQATYLAVRRVLVFIIGVSIVAVGVIMLVTPGPAFLVIPAGLALLATEFLWARRLLARLKERIDTHIGKRKGDEDREGSTNTSRRDDPPPPS